VSKDKNTEPKYQLPSLTSNTPDKEACHYPTITQVKLPQNLSAPLKDKDRKRKRAQEPEEIPTHAPSKRLRKRPRTSVANPDFENAFGESAADGVANNKVSAIEYWIEEERWPEEYFEQDDQTRKDLERDSWFEKYWEPENMSHLLARKKSLSSLRGKQTGASSITPSDQKPREIKNDPYKDARYDTLLATKGNFMEPSKLGVTATSRSFCRTFLETEQTVPEDSLFRDDLFEETCNMVQNKNEARVVRDILPLIAPSAEILSARGAKHLKILIESVNEGWNNSIPVTKTRPQPEYSVGFRREAFTEDQLKRLKPFVGELTDTSFFMATYCMYFPFLTCEAKCGAAGLNVADRQNAHSMALAVRGVVELFRLMKRENELHREILAFSISHDHCSVRIYGHYPLIDGNETTFYRHPIHKFDFTAVEGKEKWTAYKFTKNVYDIWVPAHFKRICSVIDQLPPDVNFQISQQSEPGESGLSQRLESHHFSDQSSYEAASLLEEADCQPSRVASPDVTPHTSLSEGIEGRASKKSRKRGPPGELHQDGNFDV
jgi:hypothetical protein